MIRIALAKSLRTFARDAAQLTGKTAQRDILPWDAPLLRLSQFVKVHVYRIIQAQVARSMLIQEGQDGEGLGDARDAVEGVAIDFGDVMARRVALTGRVVFGPQRLFRRRDFDGKGIGGELWGSDCCYQCRVDARKRLSQYIIVGVVVGKRVRNVRLVACPTDECSPKEGEENPIHGHY